MSRKRYTFLPLFALTVLFAFLIPLNLIATTWGEVSVYLMMHKADIIAICEVVRYPCNTIPSTPDEETAGRGLGFIRPGFIRIRLIDVLVGIEDDKDLLVDWVDRSRDTSIKEGHEYIVFLWRRAGKMLFLNEPPESERRINYAGIEINNNYQRFNSKYWIREIADGKIVWVNDQILSIDEFTALISREREKPYPPAKPSRYRLFVRRINDCLHAKPHYLTATVFILIGVLIFLFRHKTCVLRGSKTNKSSQVLRGFTINPGVWTIAGLAWIIAGVALYFI